MLPCFELAFHTPSQLMDIQFAGEGTQKVRALSWTTRLGLGNLENDGYQGCVKPNILDN